MITSASNEKVKHLIQLREKGKVRRKEGLFIAEGIRLVRDIPEGDTVELYYSESYEGERAAGKIEILSDELFKKVSDTETPQGVLAVVRMRKSTSADIINAVKNPMILLLENIQDPGNMGTMFRTAEAAGCSGIIMTE
jgi:TrmH family RNA methyltransferase